MTLQEAKTKLSELEGQVEDSFRLEVSQIKGLIEDAEKLGEGQEIEALRQQIEDMITLNAKFISVMVHEIRKPMTSIRGYADMLDKKVVGELNDMQAQFVSTIRTNVISMERLVADISDLSKMQSGRVEADQKMDMAKNILMEVEKETRELAEERNHELVFDVPDGLPLLNSDKVRIVQALIKLVDNAIKYTHQGGTVRVTAAGTDEGLQIEVQDNGVGLHAEEINRLGELFFRGDDELVLNTKGYGMGIPITMECMRLVGGRFYYSSEKGTGSTFGIVVPVMS